MTSVQGYRCFRQKNPSIVFLGSSLPPKSELFDQLVGHLEAKFLIAIVLAIAFVVPKYTKKDLQRILKTVLEPQAPNTSEEP